MAISVLHRASGVFLSLGAVILVWWLYAVARGGAVHEAFLACINSWLGCIALFGWTAAMMLHLLNGIRHLFWDVGLGFSRERTQATGWMVAEPGTSAAAIAAAYPPSATARRQVSRSNSLRSRMRSTSERITRASLGQSAVWDTTSAPDRISKAAGMNQCRPIVAKNGVNAVVNVLPPSCGMECERLDKPQSQPAANPHAAVADRRSHVESSSPGHTGWILQLVWLA